MADEVREQCANIALASSTGIDGLATCRADADGAYDASPGNVTGEATVTIDDAAITIPEEYKPVFESAVSRFTFGAVNPEAPQPTSTVALYARPPRASLASGAARRKDRRSGR